MLSCYRIRSEKPHTLKMSNVRYCINFFCDLTCRFLGKGDFFIMRGWIFNEEYIFMACDVWVKYYSKKSISGLMCRLMVWHSLGFKTLSSIGIIDGELLGMFGEYSEKCSYFLLWLIGFNDLGTCIVLKIWCCKWLWEYHYRARVLSREVCIKLSSGY